MNKYEVLTKKSVMEYTEEEAKEREQLPENQDRILEWLGYEPINELYTIHFFESSFREESVEELSIYHAIEYLAIKDGADLVKFDNGKIGFVSYYNGEMDGFEIGASATSKKELVTEYLEDLRENYTNDYIEMWKRFCYENDWVNPDSINNDLLIGFIVDEGATFGDEELIKIINA